MARTMKEKALYIEEQKQRMYAQFLLKGYSPAQITELLANYPKLIAGLDCQPLPEWFREALVCWYNPSKQKLTNEQIVAGEPFLLKDFSGNGLDMTMHNFAGEGMSGMDGYSVNFNNCYNVIPGNVFTDKTIQVNYVNQTQAIFSYNIKLFNSKLKCSGIASALQNAEIEYAKLYAEGDFSGGVDLKDGVNEVNIQSETSYVFLQIRATSSSAESPYKLKNPILIEALPLYEGGLVFDGTDDYGISENQPILTDYTFITRAKIIKRDAGSTFVRKSQTGAEGAFNYYADNFGLYSYSFGGSDFKDRTSAINGGIIYQTKKSFNGEPTTFGTEEDTKILVFGQGKTSWVIWDFLLFNRTLTPDEIDWVKYNIMGEELPKPIAKWDAEGRRNDEPEAIRNILLDKSGNGHHITLNNFAFAGMSGYGGYEFDFTTMDGKIPNLSMTATKIVTKENQENKFNGIVTSNTTEIPEMLVRVMGGNFTLIYFYYDGVSRQKMEISKNGEYILPKSSISTENFVVGFQIKKCDTSITIEQLGKYPNAIVFDGVDDYGICENMPIFTKEKGYTVIAERVWFDGNEQYDCFLSKRQLNNATGAFLFERKSLPPYYDTYNWGAGYSVKLPSLISYQTSTLYNGITIPKGNAIDGERLILGSNNIGSGFWNGGFYKLHIFDHDLTPIQIETYIRRNINPAYTLPQNQ